MIVKPDRENSFDRFNHNYLAAILKKIGFSIDILGVHINPMDSSSNKWKAE